MIRQIIILKKCIKLKKRLGLEIVELQIELLKIQTKQLLEILKTL